MPRPGLPLTPGSSTDLKGKDGVNQIASLHLAFELPPPAIHDAARTSPGKLSPGSSLHHGQPHHQHMSPPTYPMQAAETVKARRRSSAATRETQDSNAAFALPPPPTRSRKIIQMKPRHEDAAAATAESSAPKDGTGKGGGGGTAKAAKTTAASASGGGGAASAAGASGKSGKKQPSATSAAGRKIARKTAHSLIERRRRSKMNEEFAVLKNMIPACTGDMHKLAILQVSAAYTRNPHKTQYNNEKKKETNRSRLRLSIFVISRIAFLSSRLSTKATIAVSSPPRATLCRRSANSTRSFTASRATWKCPTRKPCRLRLPPAQTTTTRRISTNHLCRRRCTRKMRARAITRTRPRRRPSHPSIAITASPSRPRRRRPLGPNAMGRTLGAARPRRRRR